MSAGKNKQQAWTDYEYGFIQDHEDWTAREIAEELGRSVQAVYQKRWRMANGWSPQMAFWDISEDEIIIAAGAYSTIASLAEKLPGRSEEAIQSRRLRLGVEQVNSNHKRPTTIGARPLVARTCTVCGLLLAADWFVWLARQRQWSPNCKKCRSGFKANHGPWTEASKKAADESFARFQTLTMGLAARSGEPYTEEDHAILRDPDLTLLQKALRIQRSYAGVRSMCTKSGYKSHVGLGDPERDQWKIDNPNAKEYAL